MDIENRLGKHKERKISNPEKKMIGVGKIGLKDLYFDKLINKQEFHVRKKQLEDNIKSNYHRSNTLNEAIKEFAGNKIAARKRLYIMCKRKMTNLRASHFSTVI